MVKVNRSLQTVTVHAVSSYTAMLINTYPVPSEKLAGLENQLAKHFPLFQ